MRAKGDDVVAEKVQKTKTKEIEMPRLRRVVGDMVNGLSKLVVVWKGDVKLKLSITILIITC